MSYPGLISNQTLLYIDDKMSKMDKDPFLQQEIKDQEVDHLFSEAIKNNEEV